MTILIAGCGYLGTHLGKDLLRKGHEVWGLRRNPVALAGSGIRPLTADLSKPETLKALPPHDVAVLAQAPGGHDGDYESTYVLGTKNFIEAARRHAPKLIQISSTGVYGTDDGSWVDEKTDPKPADTNGEALLGAEALTRESGLRAVILRLGGLYGPRRHRLKPLKEGKIKPVLSEKFVNRIRVEDAAAAVEVLMEKGESGEIYLGVDDLPSTQKEFYGWLCPRMGIRSAPADAGPEKSLGKRCSNRKLKALGMCLVYPDFRLGYADLLKEV